MGIYGQDWASYQSAQPDTSGLSFAFVKITEGLGYVNPRWSQQRDHAKADGLVFGAYHYPHMDNDPHVEADRFLAQVAWQPGDMICLDWEGYDPANTGVSKARQLAYKDAWLRYVKGRMPHNPVGMYANVDYWNNVDTSGYYADFLWIATAGRAAGNPGISAPWLFHQYGDSPVDSDYCHLGSVDELRTWALSFSTPTPTPLEDIVTPQDIDAIAAAVWNHALPDQGPDGRPLGSSKSAYWFLVWQDVYAAKRETEAAQLQSAITALAAQVSSAHPGVDTAAVVAAVQKAIADAVVHVHVDVASTPPAATT